MEKKQWGPESWGLNGLELFKPLISAHRKMWEGVMNCYELVQFMNQPPCLYLFVVWFMVQHFCSLCPSLFVNLC